MGVVKNLTSIGYVPINEAKLVQDKDIILSYLCTSIDMQKIDVKTMTLYILR